MRATFTSAILALSCLALSACGLEPLTQQQIAALDPTPVSQMPKGTASYTGEITYEYQGTDGSSGTLTGDYQLDADFDNSTVSNTATNFVGQSYENGVKSQYAETTGILTGSGFIVDNAFSANLTGDLTTVRAGTSAKDAADIAGDNQEITTIDLPVSGQFMGRGARAIYGNDKTTSQDGSLQETVTVYGNKD